MGQSCNRGQTIHCRGQGPVAVEELFVERMSAAKFGDPLSDQTELGRSARHDLRDALHDQVQRSVAMAQRCLLGARYPTVAVRIIPRPC